MVLSGCLFIDPPQELQRLDAEAFELACSLCWEQELSSSLQHQQDLLQQVRGADGAYTAVIIWHWEQVPKLTSTLT